MFIAKEILGLFGMVYVYVYDCVHVYVYDKGNSTAKHMLNNPTCMKFTGLILT